MLKVTASIVVYQEKEQTLTSLLKCFAALEAEKEVIVVDNSPDDSLRSVCEAFPDVSYHFAGRNLGFGAGHNLAFARRRLHADLHLVVNPDIRFAAEELHDFLVWFDAQEEIVLAVPKLLNPDGSLQHSVREIPTPSALFRRRVNPFGLFDASVARDEWQNVPIQTVTDIPFAHGAFLAFKSDVFEKLGGFDERFFMYMEDADIFIRAKKFGRTVIQPSFTVVHEHRRASAKNRRLLVHHLVSAFRFFRKHH